MRVLKDKTGVKYYLAEEVEEEIGRLNEYIKVLERKIASKTENLRPREAAYPKEIQVEIAKRVLWGESKRSLANEFNVSRSTILRYFRENESEARQKIGCAVLTPLEATEAVEMYRRGLSVDSIRDYLKKDDRAVRIEISKVYGIQTPCKGCGNVTMYFKRAQNASPSCPECGLKLETMNVPEAAGWDGDSGVEKSVREKWRSSLPYFISSDKNIID